MTVRLHKKHRTWISVRQGRGSIEAKIISAHAVTCHDCLGEMWWAARKDNPEKKFPAHREVKHEEGETRVIWWNHTIFCPVAGVLARETGKQPML